MDISFNYILTLMDLVFKSIFSLYLSPPVIVMAKKISMKYPKTAVKSDVKTATLNCCLFVLFDCGITIKTAPPMQVKDRQH